MQKKIYVSPSIYEYVYVCVCVRAARSRDFIRNAIKWIFLARGSAWNASRVQSQSFLFCFYLVQFICFVIAAAAAARIPISRQFVKTSTFIAY